MILDESQHSFRTLIFLAGFLTAPVTLSASLPEGHESQDEDSTPVVTQESSLDRHKQYVDSQVARAGRTIRGPSAIVTGLP